jgi:putative ABC transport system permease protein
MSTMEEITIGSIEEGQNWDVQANVPFGGEVEAIDWAEEKGAEYQKLLIFPVNPVNDSRVITAYGLEEISTGSDSMIVVDLRTGSIPESGKQTTEILIDEGLSHFLGWQVGDTRTLVFGSELKSVDIVGITQGEVSRTVYFHRSDLAEVIGIEATSVLINLPEGVEADSELAEVSLGITEKDGLIASYEAVLEQQQSFLGSILLLGILIAIVVLFNTLLMNLSERDKEIATLRVLGAPIKRLGWMMFGEHLAIGLFGGVLAFFFTLAGTQAMISSFVQWSFFMTVTVDPIVAALLVGVVVVTSVALTPYGMWRISRMDLVEKVKDLSQ